MVKRVKEARTAYAAEPVQAAYPPQGEWTYEDYVHLPDDGWKYEVIEGVLYMAPSPNTKHQLIVGNLFFAIKLHLKQAKIGQVFSAPLDVILPGNLGTPVQPDLLFIRQDRLEIVKEQHIEGAPDLVVEVLSPSNWVDDRREKFKIYAAAKIPEFWIVDPIQRTVEVFVLDLEGDFVLLDRYKEKSAIRSQVLADLNLLAAELFPE
ncbi:MAG: Uma2 family endonuclease [Caldilineaceae bacterium]|nr:Uma2 family endonuclease [Caldilineaceae bacterium]